MNPSRQLTAAPHRSEPPEAALAALLDAPDGEAKESAWGLFVEAYTPLLLHTAYRFGRTYDGAMDRYTYLLEHLHRDDFRRLRSFETAGSGRFSTWLVVVARRLFQDYYRSRYGRPRPSLTPAGADRALERRMRRNLAEMVAVEVSPSLRDGSVPSPDAAAQATERAEAVRAAVLSLEPRDRLLLKLRFEGELAGHEIAKVMGFPTPFHVYRRLRTVLGVLARRLRREYAEAVS